MYGTMLLINNEVAAWDVIVKCLFRTIKKAMSS